MAIVCARDFRCVPAAKALRLLVLTLFRFSSRLHLARTSRRRVPCIIDSIPGGSMDVTQFTVDVIVRACDDRIAKVYESALDLLQVLAANYVAQMVKQEKHNAADLVEVFSPAVVRGLTQPACMFQLLLFCGVSQPMSCVLVGALAGALECGRHATAVVHIDRWSVLKLLLGSL